MSARNASAVAFRLILELKTPYIPPATTPTLDGILWGALSRCLGQASPVPLDAILTRSHGVFHGSRAATADALSAENDSVTFYRSLMREREQMPEFFFDKKRYPRFSGRSHDDVTKDVRYVVVGDNKRGFFKPFLNKYPLVLGANPETDDSLLTVAFFGHGDIERVRGLLRFLPGIGRKVRQGYGLIGSVRIDVIDQDISLVRDGYPMRPIPAEEWETIHGHHALQARPMAVVPPYLISPPVLAVAPEDSIFVRIPKETML